MSDHIRKTIADLQDRIRQQEEETARAKRTVNDLCRLAGTDPIYQDASLQAAGPSMAIQSDRWFGETQMSTPAREYLTLRKAAGLGPATVDEIFDAMKEGGFRFETDEDNAKRILRITLTKNSYTFTKLPSGKYGLTAWYPALKESKKKQPGAGNGVEAGAGEEPGEGSQTDPAAEGGPESPGSGGA